MYLYLYLYTYLNFPTSFPFTHCVTHQISVSGVPSFTHAGCSSPSFRQTQAAAAGARQTRVCPKRSCKPEPHHRPHSNSPCASISSICHQPSLTHANSVLTFTGVVARERRTSRQLSIFFHITPSEGRAAVSDHVCVSFNDVTSGAVHIHP